MNNPDKPHFIDWGEGKGLEPASTEEIVPVVMQHINHDGIFYFGPNCAECVKAKEAGKYPHWFPPETP